VGVFYTKLYDREFFEAVNRGYGFDLAFLQDHLTANSALRTANL